MKTYREIFTFKTLYQAHLLTRRSKRHKKEIVLFEMETGKNTPEDDLDYLSQSIEIDAIAFAHKMMLEHFQVKTVIPEVVVEKVKSFLSS